MDTTALVETITAEEIAEREGVNVLTVRRWFRRGLIAGKKIRHSWTTTLAEYARWKAGQPDASRYDLTAETIAGECGVSVKAVWRWFAEEGLPGEKVRAVGERAASWRTTREQFRAWYEVYLTGCPAHRPVQHRDQLGPWCDHCGHDASGALVVVPARLRAAG